MVQVVDYEEFSVLKREVEELRADNEFIRSLLLGERWLSRKQAMSALNCRDDKLRKLTLSKTLIHRYEGKKPQYDVFSIRAYLTAQSIDSVAIDRRLLTAKYAI